MDKWKARKEGQIAPQEQKRPPFKYKRLDKYATPPYQSTEDSAGWDLSSLYSVTIYPGDILLIHTGIAVEIPKGNYGNLTARSSMGKRGVRVAGATSVIDADYRGEILVYLINDGAYKCDIAPGERVVQMVIQPYTKCELVEVDELSETNRGTGGFGSTGR